ncbi:hypothetical protein [Massilia brevitalea]|uniref:hypothetical protein n=1 Tax=Massilia brevitalea TaxID=442526 RepID=UPI00273950F0|nr:hypothetical protein [Massilia brevitalea]
MTCWLPAVNNERPAGDEGANVTRPIFQPSDDEARILINRLQSINAAHPLNQRDHGPFVRAFVRAVYEATGKTFSPVIYRRLLDAYAPDRRPSTSTLERAKQSLLNELDLEREGAAEIASADALHLGALIRNAVFEAVGAYPVHPPHVAGSSASPGTDVAFWRERAAESERAVAEAQAQAARLAGELLAARASFDAASAELAAARNQIRDQAAQIGKLAAEFEQARLFSMRAIDDARGETRAWRERCASVEAQAVARAREDNILLETFRQLAYQRGAAIPPVLQKGPK